MSLAHLRPASLAAAYDHCWAITKREAGNFYYGFVALPVEKRRAIYAAYAFSRRVDDEADEAGDPAERAARLAESRRRLAEAYAGQADDPVLVALGDAVRRYQIPQVYFEDLITGVEMDLTISRYRTFDDLWLYCYRVASVVGLICLEIFGYRDPRARVHAVDLGIALQLTNILRDVAEDAGRDRIYLPLDELAEFGVTEADILTGRQTGLVRSLMRAQAERAQVYHDRGRQLLPLLDVRSRACTGTMQALYEAILRRIEDQAYDVFAGRVSLSTPRKLALMGQVWLRSLWGAVEPWPG
ncbi:MAG TPA: presqualene diphosphate synthase HpnD [Dehalococcoidia bacterium]|nr:presqualene diphosphate synthase HpnD [Dehalococcoidia bacterium]